MTTEKQKTEANGERVQSRSDSTALLAELVLMVDVFCACIETEIFPFHGSNCHRRARKLVEKSGMKPKRKRRPFNR